MANVKVKRILLKFVVEHSEGKRAVFENNSLDVEFDGYIQESFGDWI